MRIVEASAAVLLLIIGCDNSKGVGSIPESAVSGSGGGSANASPPLKDGTDAMAGTRVQLPDGSGKADDVIAPDDDRSATTAGGDGGVASAPAGNDASSGVPVAQTGAGDAGPDASLSASGEPAQPYAVGTIRIEINAGKDRVLPVQLWYPALESARVEATQGHPTEEFEPAGETRQQLASMLAKSRAGCTSKTMHAALAPQVLAQGTLFPGVVFSHGSACIRSSTFTVAEHLASLGFVVAAPDHVNGTVYDATPPFDEAFLKTRTNDIRTVIDSLLDAQNSSLPAGLRGRIDPDRIGMYGHSFGSITTGRVLRDDPRVKAGVMIAAPIDVGTSLLSVILDRTELAKIKQPALFLEAAEDDGFLNTPLEENYSSFQNPAWFVQLKNAGHFSFTDIAGFRMDEPSSAYAPGCGTGTRSETSTDHGLISTVETFTYLDNDVARGITKAYVAAFFQAQLKGDASANAYLEASTPAEIVTAKHHP